MQTNKSDKLHEECGVFGASFKESETAPLITYNGLISLQHRGQEGAGIASLVDGKISCHRGVGLVGQVFPGDVLNNLPPSNLAIGHVQYSSSGCRTADDVQPIVTDFLTGRLSVVCNCSIVNSKALKSKLKAAGVKLYSKNSSEIIANLIGLYSMQLGDFLQGTVKAAQELEGSFSIAVLTSDGKLIALRDGSGFRPLCIGENKNGMVVASENCALDGCGFKFVRDLLPGEVVVLQDGKITYEKVEITPKINDSGLCIFEYVYFARPDSTVDGLNVFQSRYRMGIALAKEHPVDADVICGVPDSGLIAAMGYSRSSRIPLVSGFVKNRYLGRSFIYPTQLERESVVQLKLNPLRAEVEGKSVVMVDDSIVRGTTCARIVKLLKKAGAREVHVRISSPPFKYICHFGTDIGSEKHLIANQMEVAQIREKLGADSLGFISLEGLKNACSGCTTAFCTKCFTGNGDLKLS